MPKSKYPPLPVVADLMPNINLIRLTLAVACVDRVRCTLVPIGNRWDVMPDTGRWVGNAGSAFVTQRTRFRSADRVAERLIAAARKRIEGEACDA